MSNRDPDTFEVVVDGLTLIFRDDDDLMMSLVGQGIGLERFVAGAYVAEYDSDQDALTLISDEPLSELLSRHALRFRAYAPALDAVLDDDYKPPPMDELTSYCGQHYICDYLHEDLEVLCSESLCASDYSRIEGSLCLIYLELSGSNWHKMNFYPFHTRLGATGMEKIRAAQPFYRREPEYPNIGPHKRSVAGDLAWNANGRPGVPSRHGWSAPPGPFTRLRPDRHRDLDPACRKAFYRAATATARINPPNADNAFAPFARCGDYPDPQMLGRRAEARRRGFAPLDTSHKLAVLCGYNVLDWRFCAMHRDLILASFLAFLLPIPFGMAGWIMAFVIWGLLILYLLAATWDLLGGSILTPRDP